jgi:MFS family permease
MVARPDGRSVLLEQQNTTCFGTCTVNRAKMHGAELETQNTSSRNSTYSNGSELTGYGFMLVSLSLGWVMIYADRLSISPLMNLIQHEFNISFSAVSLLLSIYFFTYVLFTIPAMLLAERYGYKKTMISFLLVAAAALALAGLFGTTYYSLLILLGVHGLGAGAYYPTAYKISNQITPKANRGFSTAIINSGMGIGTIVGLGIAGPLLAFLPYWQVILVLLSIPTFLVAILLFRSIKVPESTQPSFRLQSFRTLMRNRQFVAICSMMFCSLYGYWVILSWGPSFLQSTRGLGIFYSGLATGIFAAVAIPSSIIIGKYSDKIGRRNGALVLLPLASLAIFTMAVTNNLLLFIIGIALYGVVGKLTLDPVAVAWVDDIVETESLGAALAVLNVFAMGSSIIAPVVTGVLADMTGTLAYGFYFGGAVVLFGIVFVLVGTKDTNTPK